MALEAVVFQQELHGCTMELCAIGGAAWDYRFGECEEGVVGHEHPMSEKRKEQGRVVALDGVDGAWDHTCSWSPEAGTEGHRGPVVAAGRRKRRRAKAAKNKEEVESQRMNHIAIERNRRKQMNEYLAVLRSLMPASYVRRGDQASVVGGAINFVKELEQLLQSLEAHKRTKQHSDATAPFAGFFTFPQYTWCSSGSCPNATSAANSIPDADMADRPPSMADIEVTMVESHANLRVLAPRRPKQLLKMVVGLQALSLTALHLNVTTMEELVLYSFSLKLEDDCQLSSVDDIAAAVYEMVARIDEESHVCN